MTFQGHVLSWRGIETDPEKTRTVDEWPTPENLTELRSFLGLASYYRWFIVDFSIIAEPLYRLSKKGVKFQWGPEQGMQVSFTDGTPFIEMVHDIPRAGRPDYTMARMIARV